jgi:hypothetical protein
MKQFGVRKISSKALTTIMINKDNEYKKFEHAIYYCNLQ